MRLLFVAAAVLLMSVSAARSEECIKQRSATFRAAQAELLFWWKKAGLGGAVQLCIASPSSAPGSVRRVSEHLHSVEITKAALKESSVQRGKLFAHEVCHVQNGDTDKPLYGGRIFQLEEYSAELCAANLWGDKKYAHAVSAVVDFLKRPGGESQEWERLVEAYLRESLRWHAK